MSDLPIDELKGVGPATAKQLADIGIRTIHDLLFYFPRKYNDFSKVVPIKNIAPGIVTIKASFKAIKGRYIRRGMHITEAVASDESASVKIIWFNQPYRAGTIKLGTEYFITGKFELRSQHFSITNPSTELLSDMPLHTARIVPIYKETKEINSTLLRKLIKQALIYLQYVPEILPKWLRQEYKLIDFKEAIEELHFPSSEPRLDSARQTFAFIEVFELMLAAQINKQTVQQEIAPRIHFNETLAKQFVASLPYKLTNAQRKAIWQIYKDIQKSIPMNRLLEGDVGSGKTVVAAMAAMMVMAADMQVALLAPTELLARQHAETLTELLSPLHYDKKLSLLVGSLKQKQKTVAHQKLKSGDIGLIVGTHALLQENINLKKLGLLIVDEQHRFGVEQRKRLLKQNGQMAHVLSMTATPIPRSLALTLYGELDISLLDELPPGRMPIRTSIVSPNSREVIYKHIEDEIKKHHQIYIVCPLIMDNIMPTVSVTTMYEALQQKFKGYSVGLLHGKLSAEEKEVSMMDFVKGNTNILVATTVIEVGVNVPNATIMVIEGADRFGLAQMHQLRGRVGRSNVQGYCYLVPSDSKAPSRRLRALATSTNGFELAELDLEIRGPGAIYGTLQHGELDLRFASLTDAKLLINAREAVRRFIEVNENLNKYPALKKRVRYAQAVVTLN